MDWYKISLPRNREGLDTMLHISGGFRMTEIQKGHWKDTVLLTEKTEENFNLYFSPACKEFCGDLIDHYAGVPCEKPRLSPDIGFDSGDESFWESMK